MGYMVYIETSLLSAIVRRTRKTRRALSWKMFEDVNTFAIAYRRAAGVQMGGYDGQVSHR